MRYPKFITTIFFLLLLFNAMGQNIFNNWYFGKAAGITFNSIPPLPLTGGQTDQLEGCASISTNTGALLFYTDGVKVWNKNHVVMPNGNGLMGNWSASQSAVIVPMPGSAFKYYIFTVTDWMNNGDLRYSIVDMSLNAGNGDIVAASKNVLLSTNQTEKLVAANATNCGVWILSHQRDNNRFEAHLVTASGVSSPVFSNTGSVHTTAPTPPDNYNNLTGVMKVSKNNLKIGLATLARIIELFDFNPATGVVSNPIALPMAAPKQGYGVCFSPDNSKFYITEADLSQGAGYDVFQFDLSSGVPATIISSKILAGRALLPIHIVGDLQIGPDNKIYFTRQETSFLGNIPNPNLPVPACGFSNTGVALGAGICKGGLPNDIRVGGNAIQVNLGNDTTLCPGEQLTLTAPVAASYQWSTGAVTQSIAVSATGQYWVDVSNGACLSTDTINVTVALPTANLGIDTALCQGQTITLNAGAAGSYQWSTGAGTQTISVTTAGQYWVKVTRGNCFNTDTINISYNAPPNVNLGIDTTLCQGQSIILNAGSANNYLWSTGAASQTINVTAAGQYWVKATNGNCAAIDTINISYATPLNVNLGKDTILCQGQSIILNAGAANNYLWSTGATSQTITATIAGQYWVKATAGNCPKTDTILINYKFPPSFLFPADTTVCSEQGLILNAGTAIKYLWSTGETTQTINVIQSGNYTVNINYYNACQKQFFTTVKFESCDCLLFMPSAFTPNADGRNDTYKPAKKSGCQFLSFLIFNRYGQIIYQTTDLNKGWDGKYLGKDQNPGTFVWQVLAKKDGQTKLFKGTVILIR